MCVESQSTVAQVLKNHNKADMNRIGTFRDVAVRPNSLVLVDIDETILFYEQIDERWWQERTDYHVQSLNCDRPSAFVRATEDWFAHIREHLPQPTDAAGFATLLGQIRRSNSTLRLVTARNPKYKAITDAHLSHLGLGDLSGIVCYLSGASKGHYIRDNLAPGAYDSVVFIDDLAHNIASVAEALRAHPRLETFQFVMGVARLATV